MRFALVLAVLLVAGGASRADALTIRDVIELTKAGITDEVLLALIDVDAGVYAIDPATLKALKEAGVSERVMVALVRSGRHRPAPEPVPVPVQDEEPAPAPQVVVVEHHEPEVRQVAVPVPVYVPVYTGRPRSRGGHDRNDGHGAAPVDSTYVPFQSGLPAARPEPQRSAPVYWGFGGKLRPDAWQPAHDRGKPSEKDSKDANRDRK
jgi:hypothetical protein